MHGQFWGTMRAQQTEHVRTSAGAAHATAGNARTTYRLSGDWARVYNESFVRATCIEIVVVRFYSIENVRKFLGG